MEESFERCPDSVILKFIIAAEFGNASASSAIVGNCSFARDFDAFMERLSRPDTVASLGFS